MATVDFQPVTGPYRWAGWAVIAVAFSIPFIYWGLGALDAEGAGEYSARAVGSLFAIAAIGWLITRKRGPRAKANARIAVGLVLFSVVFANVSAASREREEMKAYLAQALKMQETHAATFAELNERFSKLPMEAVLAPTNTTTPQGIASGKATVAQIRALVAERDALLSNYMAKVKAMVASIPSASGQRGAQAGMAEPRNATTLQGYAALSKAQTATADAIERILDWCAAQGSTLATQKGQLLFANAQQQAQYLALLGKLEAAEAAEADVLAKLQANEEAVAVRLQQNRIDAAKILQK